MSLEPSENNLLDVFDLPKERSLAVFYDRMVSVPVSALASLKKELHVAMGRDRSKGIFIRYGWHSGVSDGEKALKFKWDTETDLVRAGPMFHKLHGYLDDVNITDLKFDDEGTIELIEVDWFNSYEVDEYDMTYGFSEKPVCHTLCGYASGYLSKVLGQTILVKEKKCKAMGHDHCEVVMMPLDKWGEEQKDEYKYYQSTSMIEELDEISAKLKEERDYLSTANDVHRRLIEELLAKQGLQNIVDLLYETTGLPAFIEDQNHKIVMKSDDVNIDFDLKEHCSDVICFTDISPELSILRTPIYFEHSIRGYCTFLYKNGEQPTDLEYMIIEQASLTSSIILLNDDVRMNTELNIRRGFLSDILEDKLEKEELYKIAHYLNFTPEDFYWTIAFEREINTEDLSHEIELNEALLRHVNMYLQERGLKGIATQKSGKIIIVINYSQFKTVYNKQAEFIDNLLTHCKKRFKDYQFYVGVSSVTETIDDIPALYNESLSALKTKSSNKTISYFDDMGIESMLFQISDDSLIDKFVEKQVGRLLEEDTNLELTQTLNDYIENGMNINATAKAITMSISGLRYRLSKVSDILEIELDDTKSLFSVYMALNILRSKGKI